MNIPFLDIRLKYITIWPGIIFAITIILTGIYYRYFIDGDNIPEPIQTMLVSLTVTTLVYIVLSLYRIDTDLKKYKKWEGSYIGYAYESDTVGAKDFYIRHNEPQSEAIIEYLGNGNFTIHVTADVQDSDLEWIGDLKMVSSNMADIAWWYVSDGHKDSMGYKKSIFVTNDQRVKLALFSVDNSIHGRELFIKK